MTHESTNNYMEEIKKLEAEVAKVSDEILNAQEETFSNSVHEINQTITAMSNENHLVHVIDSAAGPSVQEEGKVIDISAMGSKIDTFNELVEILKVAYLEQEALDFFLRYTISSTEFLQIESIYDEKYVKLEDEVHYLENEQLRTHHKEIEDTKLNISLAGDELANTGERLNEVLLDITDILDDCDGMMKELGQLREEHELKHAADEKAQNDPIIKTMSDWEQFKTAQNEKIELDNQLKQWTKIKKSYEFIKAVEQVESTTDVEIGNLSEIATALESLIRLWKTRFLPQNGWKNLEVYPETREFKFDTSPCFSVVIKLSQFSSIKDVKIYRMKDELMSIDYELQADIKNTDIETQDVFTAIENIVNKLNALGEEI